MPYAMPSETVLAAPVSADGRTLIVRGLPRARTCLPVRVGQRQQPAVRALRPWSTVPGVGLPGSGCIAAAARQRGQIRRPGRQRRALVERDVVDEEVVAAHRIGRQEPRRVHRAVERELDRQRVDRDELRRLAQRVPPAGHPLRDRQYRSPAVSAGSSRRTARRTAGRWLELTFAIEATIVIQVDRLIRRVATRGGRLRLLRQNLDEYRLRAGPPPVCARK